MKAVIIGAGNVATHLSRALQKAGVSIIQVYSRSTASAQALAEQIHSNEVTDIEKITDEADLYFFALKDDILPDILHQLPPNKGLWIHTAGSVSMNIFKPYTKRYGVFYPLQTFSKERVIDFSQIPCFIEASSPTDEELLQKVGSQLSDHVQLLSSEKRKYLHLAAVFACNFSNHMYVLANQILEKENISPTVLSPLIDETAAKIHTIPPAKAQTGPAVRYDQRVIENHIKLLDNPANREIYELISKNIFLEANK